MTEDIVLDSDVFNYIQFYFRAELESIELKHHIKLELDSFSASTTSGVSAVANSSNNSLLGSQFRILIKPFKSDASSDLKQLIDHVCQKFSRFNIPVPLCLAVLQKDELFKHLMDIISSERQNNFKFKAVKFYISQVAKTHIISCGRDMWEVLLRGIWETECAQYVEDVLHRIMRYLAFELIEKSLSVKAFFEQLQNVEQFSLGTKNVNLEIKVYTADLTLLPFDAIVCSSNSNLSFQAGESMRIATKAGTHALSFVLWHGRF